MSSDTTLYCKDDFHITNKMIRLNSAVYNPKSITKTEIVFKRHSGLWIIVAFILALAAALFVFSLNYFACFICFLLGFLSFAWHFMEVDHWIIKFHTSDGFHCSYLTKSQEAATEIFAAIILSMKEN